MNAYDDDNGASLVPLPVIEPRFPFGYVIIAAAIGWAGICAAAAWCFA